MRLICDYLSTAWNYKFSLAPVLLTYFLFDLLAIIRRITRKAYLPIYFMFFPLGYSDKMYAEYFNEDNYYGIGESMTDAEKAALRTRIRRVAVLSMIFAAVIAPWLCGTLSAFYLSSSEFKEFVWFLMIFKTLVLVWSLHQIRKNASFIVESNSFKYVVLIYIVYLILIYWGVSESYWWADSHLRANGFIGLLRGLADFAYFQLFISIIVVGIGTWAITDHYLDPKLIRGKDVIENQ